MPLTSPNLCIAYAEHERRLALRRRLTFQYGAERAEQIIRGDDPKARADEMAWRRLGGSRS